ncbi:MAG: hypothetical protein ACTSR2_00075 [Candidatus Hodarchaeales archaeon]
MSIERLKEALKVTDYHVFHFRGHCDLCNDEKPHVPHVIDTYSPGNPESDNAWEFERYCLGKEGFVPGLGYIRIAIWHHQPGDPHTAEVHYGYWYIEEK